MFHSMRQSVPTRTSTFSGDTESVMGEVMSTNHLGIGIAGPEKRWMLHPSGLHAPL